MLPSSPSGLRCKTDRSRWKSSNRNVDPLDIVVETPGLGRVRICASCSRTTTVSDLQRPAPRQSAADLTGPN
jgi:hypothetical protein